MQVKLINDGLPRVYTAAELMALPVKKNTRWGRWRLSKSTNELVFYEGNRRIYWLDLNRMAQSSAECLDTIFQVSQKTWMTNQDRGELLKAIQELIHPQANLCSMGCECGPASRTRKRSASGETVESR